MAGDPANVSIWIEADVLVYNAATLPTLDIPTAITDPFVIDEDKWGFLGLLVGEDGIDLTREWDETDIPAWGYGVIIVASQNFKCTGSVSALEDNPVMDSIVWPGSTATTQVVPQPSHQFVALEKRSAGGTVYRQISKRPARLWVPSVRDSEGNRNPREVQMRIFPNSARELFLVQKSA